MCHLIGFIAPEPTNHVTNFASGTVDNTSIQITWTDAVAGYQPPSAYLIYANNRGDFSYPLMESNM